MTYCGDIFTFAIMGNLIKHFSYVHYCIQVGINAVLPAPLPFFLLTDSMNFSGDLSVNGKHTSVCCLYQNASIS